MKERINRGILFAILCLGVVFFVMFSVTEDASAGTIPLSGNLTAGTTYTLTGNINLTDTLNVPNGDVTVDLNGYTVTAPSGKSAFNVNGGNLTIKDSSTAGTGKITGNTTGPRLGGGVYLESGTFTFDSGTISQCKAQTTEFKQAKGGGVYVNDGTFTIINGVIDNCSAVGEKKAKTSYGGGVYMKAGTFNMNGGRISSCTASGSKNGGNGGGVYLAGGTFSMTDGVIGENCEAVGGSSSGGYDDENHYTYNGNGGGVFVKGSFTMSGGQITKCTALIGGGVYVDASGSFTMNGGEISECNANQYSASRGGNGGGIYVDSRKEKINDQEVIYKGTLNISSPGNSPAIKISNCSSDKSGGGIFVNAYSECTLTGVSITGCEADNGGGISVNNTSCTFKSVNIISCTASTQGGGIKVQGIKNGNIYTTLNISDSTIDRCTAKGSDDGTGGGGAIYVSEVTSSTTLTNTTITNCSAVYGGGIRMKDQASVTLDGGSITGCTADKEGGGIHDNALLSVKNDVKIKDNAVGESDDNCYLASEPSYITLLNGLDNADIGVRLVHPDTQPKITARNSTYYLTALPHFKSDDPNYIVTTHEDYILLGYEISYDLDGGELPTGVTNPTCYSSHDTITGELTLSVTAPEREGYTFIGWTGSNGTEPQMNIVIPQWTRAKLSYKANWKINQYTVKFESNGGTAVADQTVNYNEKVVKPADPTKSGYVFKGWFKDSDLTEEYDFNTSVTSDLTLYAKWGEPEPTTPSTPTPITVNDPPVRKTISGDTPTTDETFTFSLSAQPELSTLPSGMTSMPMPGGVSEQTVTTTIVGSGSSEFGTFTFTAPGTYVYKIVEVDSGTANYEYDSSEYLVTYVVTESGWNLYSARTITKDGVVVTEAEYSFVNTYTTPENPVDPDEPDEPDEPDNPTKPDKPTASDTTTHPDGGSSAGGTGVNAGGVVRTGDPTDLGLWLIILLAASGTAVILVRRHRADRR